MTRDKINLIGKWATILLCLALAGFFAHNGNNDAGAAFGLGAAMMFFWGIFMDGF